MRGSRSPDLGVLIFGLLLLCSRQMPTTAQSWPEERGLIATYGPDAQICHFPGYPGYEDVPGTLNDNGVIEADVPEFRFPNLNTHITSVSIDYRTKSLYMYDNGLSQITMARGYNKDLTVNKMEFHELHAAVSKADIKVAVDWLSHTVYWTDPGFRWIVAAPGEVDKIEKDYYKVIVRSHLELPNGVAVDPIESLLFWSDSGDHPKIERSDLMGRDRHTIVHKYLRNPTCLITDVSEQRIYWVDTLTDTILTATYDGEDIKTVARVPLTNFKEMDIFLDALYVSNTVNGYIYVLNKTNGKEIENKIQRPDYRAYGIAVYGDENQPVKETDHCGVLNCDQLCITEKYDATCVCAEGFVLNEGSGQCEEIASGYHKAIVLANATYICLVDIRAFVETGFEPRCIFTVLKQKSAQDNQSSPMSTPATTTPSTVKPGDYITEFDMDMVNRILFFSTADNTIYKRPIDLEIDNDAKELIVRAAGNISGLAYDAEDPDNLYWCESDTGHVWLINTVSRTPKQITLDELENPRDVIVLLNQRRLAMIAGPFRDVSILTMTMDGQDNTTIVSGKVEIDAFTFDSEKQLFYYVSSRRMYSVSLDGSDDDVDFSGVEADVISVVLYQHYLTWAYPNDTGLSFQTRDLIRFAFTQRLTFRNLSLLDMKVLDEKLQTPEHISPCVKDNGGCEQICVTRYTNGVMTRICDCRLGYFLVNGVNCTTTHIEDDFVVVADWTNEEIFQISLNTHEVHVMPAEENIDFMGVYFDEARMRFIYSEYWETVIYGQNLNGTGPQEIVDIGYDGHPYRYDMDKTTGNLYFTAYFSSSIGIVTPSGDYTILNDDFGWDFLNDIVVHPRLGWMYYCVSGWPLTYIGRSNMDGTHPEKLIRASKGEYPDGLAIDYINDHLYWSDATFDTIQQCNLDGLDCITIVNMTKKGETEEIRDIETDGEYLYYCSYRKSYIVRVELTEPYNTEKIGQNYGFGRLDTMSFYSSTNQNIQPIFEGCVEQNGLGDCSTICLPSLMGRTCACEAGVSLKQDGRTCSNIYQCTDVMYQTVKLGSGVKETIDVTMDMACLRYIGDKCQYKCPIHFEPIFNTTLTCTETGWNLEPNTLCREILCPETIDNGKLSETCTRDIGVKCDFQCDMGFVKTQKMAVCTKDGTYHVPYSELCAPFKCDAHIDNGTLDQNCLRTIGSKCKYTCNKFYTPKDKTSMATCDASGWDSTSNKLCEESVCGDSTLMNGIVMDDCKKKIGDACTFQCDQGYAKTTSVVFCKHDKLWHPTNSCTPFTCSDKIANGALDPSCTRTLGSSCNYTCSKYYYPSVKTMQATCGATGWSPASADLCEYAKCPNAIPNGKIIGECDFTVGSTCNFKCNDGFTPSEVHPNISCNYHRSWFTDRVCLVPAEEKFKFSVPGVAAGLAVLAVVVIVLGVAAVYCVRRNMKMTSSKYDTFENNYSGGMAVENPSYGQATASSSVNPFTEAY